MASLILLGASGMFGRDAVPVFEDAGYAVVGADLPDVDITDRVSLARFLDLHPAETLVNAAAYTNVDGAEVQRQETFRVNASGARTVAEACRERRMTMVQVSTDYVYPGTRPSGYLPDDPPGPAISTYGQSKLEGERAVRETLRDDHFLVCRTQWLYGRNGKNFVDTILALARVRTELRVVNDQWGVPTHTRELARQMAVLLGLGARGFAHAVGGGGPITWYDFAKEIVDLAGQSCSVTPCATSEFPRPARRPEHAWLRNTKVPAVAVRHWQDTLAAYLMGAGGGEP